MVCRAVIAFGHTLSGAFGRKQQEPAERPCVYRDFRDKWADESAEIYERAVSDAHGGDPY